MPTLNLFRRFPDKPRLSLRERFRSTAAKILPRMSRRHRRGGGTDTGRRSLVAGSLAMAGALVAPRAAPARADMPNADARLIALADEYLALYEEQDRFARDVVEPAEGRYVEPAVPAALKVRNTDFFLIDVGVSRGVAHWIKLDDPDEWKEIRVYSGEAVEELRTIPRTRQDHSNTITKVEGGELVEYPGRKPYPAAQARADEIVAAYDEWEQAIAEARRDSGLGAAERAYEDMDKRLEELRGRIFDASAVTLEGLMAKARCGETVLFHALGWSGELGFARSRKDQGAVVDIAAVSIARDLAALAKREA